MGWNRVMCFTQNRGFVCIIMSRSIMRCLLVRINMYYEVWSNPTYHTSPSLVPVPTRGPANMEANVKDDFPHRFPLQGTGRTGFEIQTCHPKLYGFVPLLIMYTSPTRTAQPTVMAMAIMGRLTRANSRRRTLMCLRASMSRHRRPASDALNAVLKAP